MKWIGRRMSIGIGIESTRGKLVDPTYWVNALTFNHEDKVVKARVNAGYGGIWGGSQSLVAQKWAEGDMEIEMGDKSFGTILHSTFGIVSSVAFSGARNILIRFKMIMLTIAFQFRQLTQ